MKKIYFLLLLSLLLSIETIAQITPQIVGGADTDIDEVPWQVLVETNTPLNGILDACGGTIIAPNWILTACHCTFDPANGNPLNVNQIKIYAGITLRSQKNNGQIRNVVEIIRHPDYGTNPDSNSDNDIALLRLSAPLNLNANVQIIDYATQADADAGWTDPGEVATVSGWGLLALGGNQPDHLQSIEVPVEDNATAAAQWDPEPGNWDVTNNMIPTGPFATGGSGTCRGDSGGPVVVWDNSNRSILAGIVSYGEPCATGNFLDIHTRVSRYCDWIADEIATVNGPSNICSTEIYSVINIPTDATVDWEVSPSHLVDTPSGTGASASIEPVSASATGEAVITFTIEGACGSTTVTKQIRFGSPSITAEGYYYNSSPTYPLSPYYSIPNNPVSETPATVTANFSFEGAISSDAQILSQSDPSITWGVSPGSDQLSFYFDFYGSPDPWNPQSQTIVWRVTAESPCGTETYDVAFYSEVDNYNYAYYPNPASSEITIENTSYEKPGQPFNSLGTDSKGSIVIYDFNGAVVQTEEYDLNSQSFNLDVSKLKPGKYFMKIGAAREEETHQIVIRR